MRRLMDYLPSSNLSGVPELPTRDPWNRLEPSLGTLIPDNPNKPYDIKEVITKVPPTLHTPLMSGANAISGIAIIELLNIGRTAI